MAGWLQGRETLKGWIDNRQYEHVRQLMHIQAKAPIWLRDKCLLYARVFSGMPLSENEAKQICTFEYCKGLRFFMFFL
jgi:hypothetical protein